MNKIREYDTILDQNKIIDIEDALSVIDGYKKCVAMPSSSTYARAMAYKRLIDMETRDFKFKIGEDWRKFEGSEKDDAVEEEERENEKKRLKRIFEDSLHNTIIDINKIITDGFQFMLYSEEMTNSSFYLIKKMINITPNICTKYQLISNLFMIIYIFYDKIPDGSKTVSQLIQSRNFEDVISQSDFIKFIVEDEEEFCSYMTDDVPDYVRNILKEVLNVSLEVLELAYESEHVTSEIGKDDYATSHMIIPDLICITSFLTCEFEKMTFIDLRLEEFLLRRKLSLEKTFDMMKKIFDAVPQLTADRDLGVIREPGYTHVSLYTSFSYLPLTYIPDIRMMKLFFSFAVGLDINEPKNPMFVVLFLDLFVTLNRKLPCKVDKEIYLEQLLIMSGPASDTVKGDFLDCILRLSDSEDLQNRARDMLFGMTDHRLIDNVYEDKQNAHRLKLDDRGMQFLIDMYNKHAKNIPQEDDEMQHFINGIVDRLCCEQGDILDKDDIDAVNLSKVRICRDFATFILTGTGGDEVKLTPSQLVATIFLEMDSDKENGDTIKQRIIEEMIDMASTCATGHFGRFCNVFSGLGLSFKVTFEEEIFAATNGRFLAKLNKIDLIKKQDVYKEIGSKALSPDTKEIIMEILDEVGNELRDEYITQNLLNKESFDLIYARAVSKIVDDDTLDLRDELLE